ncbi:hypothetical protein H9Q69_010993 [Fusarium xylarioides]|nr:hypothetical protein H9Q69_010993 [Fusarium xylarioides]
MVLRNLERQRLLLTRSPSLSVINAQRSSENVFNKRNAETSADFERVGNGEAGGDADCGLGAVEAADDGGHGNIPVEEFFFGKDLDFGAFAATTGDGTLGGSFGGNCGGGLETLKVSGLYDLGSAISLENDDIVG